MYIFLLLSCALTVQDTIPKNIKEVVVTASKPVIKQDIDRLTYDMQADADSKGRSLLEMLRKVPYISVDAAENVLLKGSSNFKILLNGKPSSMMERNLKEVLRSIPASTIQRIEVITNPSSKYDSEGQAGIINIITNKKMGNGYNGTLNISEKLPAGGPEAGGSLSVKQGKFGFSGFGGLSRYHAPETTSSLDRKSDLISLQQQSIQKSTDNNGYIGIELSAEIDSLQLISGQFNLNGNKSHGNTFQGTQSSERTYDLSNYRTAHGSGKDAALNYQLGDKRLLTFSYRYSKYSDETNNQLTTSHRINYTTPDYNQENLETATEHTFQVDYVHPGKWLNIEAGAKGILRDNKSDFQTTIDSLSDHFKSKQNVFAVYNSYQFKIKSWNFKGGLRLEKTFMDANFVARKVKQTYTNLFPALSINKAFTDNSSITLGFSQRFKRPNIHLLNPFVDKSNPDVEVSGNPNLKSSLMNNVQLEYSYSKKLSVNAGVRYMFFNDMDIPILHYDSATSVTRQTTDNNGKGDAISFDLNMRYPITNKWNISFNGNVTCYSLIAMNNLAFIKMKGIASVLFVSTAWKFDNGWRAGANFNILGKQPTTVQGTHNAYFSSSVSVNKDLIKDKLSFSAYINNPFTKYRTDRITTIDPYFTQTSYNQEYFRAYSVSMNYSFGKLKEKIKKASREIHNDDVSK
jgi:ferric enterobactin receptor